MSLGNDLRQAGRRLARRPGFLVLGSLALGGGLAGVALVFALVNTFVLRPLPGVHAPTPVLEIGRVSRGGHFDSFSWPDFVDLRDQARTIEQVFAYRSTPAYLRHGEGTEQATAQLVSGNYFTALGVRAGAGRLLGPEHDAAPGGAPVVVASHAAFQRWFGGDLGRIGSRVQINGGSYTLVGVTAPDFRGTEPVLATDFFVPMSMVAEMNVHPAAIFDQRGSRWMRTGARLAPGASLDQAREELAALARRLAESHPRSNGEVSFQAATMAAVPNEARKLLSMAAMALLVLCGAVLLLAASNLGGVMLAQGEARQPELAMRSVLGAGRGRLVRQLLFEALGVGLLAACIGLALAWAGRRLLNLIPLPTPAALDLSLLVDARVMVATVLVAVLVSLGFGLWPALRVSALAPGRGAALREAGSGRVSSQRGRHALLAVQACLTVTLLLVAGLVVRAVQDAADVDTGFVTEGVYFASLDLQPLGIDAERGSEELNQLAARLREAPGIEQAGFATVVPLTMSSLGFGSARLPGQEGEPLRLDVNTVGEGFLETLGVQVRGRGILASDRAGGERVAVINQTLARQLFGDAEPLGRSFEMGSGEEWDPLRVVGVVADGRYSTLDDAGKAFAYLPAPQWPRAEFSLFMRSPLPPGEVAERLQSALGGALTGLPRPQLQRFSDAARVSLLPQMLLAGAASALGLLGLALAATGLYGVLAFQVLSRTREIGVRKALGANSARIASSVLRRSLVVLGIGGLVGLLIGQGAGQLLGSVLFGVRALDPLANAAVVLLFVGMVLVAMAGPLARALRLAPSEALRQD